MGQIVALNDTVAIIVGELLPKEHGYILNPTRGVRSSITSTTAGFARRLFLSNVAHQQYSTGSGKNTRYCRTTLIPISQMCLMHPISLSLMKSILTLKKTPASSRMDCLFSKRKACYCVYNRSRSCCCEADISHG